MNGEIAKERRRMALLALGSNLTSTYGNPVETLNHALHLFQLSGAMIRDISAFYRTPAFPEGSGPDFVNAAAAFEVPWNAAETLRMLHTIEAQMGRVRDKRWGQRTLDLDLIAIDDAVLPDPETHRRWRNLDLAAQQDAAPDQLILPHPRLQDRAFVLIPLLDIAPDWVHPVLGQSVQQMCDALPAADKASVVPLPKEQIAKN